MRYALVLMDDTRDFLGVHRDRILAALHPAPVVVVEHVDTEKRGYTAQMVSLWRDLADRVAADEFDYVLLWEADFLPEGMVPVRWMRDVLDGDPWLAQVALVRQPWFANEKDGLLTSLERQGIRLEDRGGYLEHRGGWTCNPCLFPAVLPKLHPWPDCAWSEAAYGQRLRKAGYRFSYLGGRLDSPRVIHHGVRTEESHGY